MQGSDVIELGSSDDEDRPAPKQEKKTQKVSKNVTSLIPKKLPGVTIKLQNSNHTKKIPVIPQVEKLVRIPSSSYVLKNNIRHPSPNKGPRKQLLTDVNWKNRSINPISYMMSQNNMIKISPNLLKKPVQCLKIGSPVIQMPNMPPIPMYKTMSAAKSQQNAKSASKPCLKKLPSDITIKKTTSLKRKLEIVEQNTNKQQKILNVGTMNCDAKIASQSTSSTPQWYLKPEESETNNLEVINNTEPDNKTIEITIEDSPMKSGSCGIGTEYPITISDSPIKPVNTHKKSEAENEHAHDTPRSKKKLDYETENVTNCITSGLGNVIITNIVSVEFENAASIATQENGNSKSLDEVPAEKAAEDKIIEKVISPNKNLSDNSNHDKPNSIEEVQETTSVGSDFHPIYEQFIKLCFSLENSEDMKRIVDKKIKAYYLQVPKTYTESELFVEMISSKIATMKADPDKMYLYIKDVVDELNLQRKLAKSGENSTNKKPDPNDSVTALDEHGNYDIKRNSDIRKLEKTLKKLHRAIQKLEEQEVDFEDDCDSVYLLTDRYKQRLMKVHAKLCQLTNTKMPSEPHIHIECRPGKSAVAARKVELLINKKVPIGAPLPFPDFHDVLKCVRDVNREANLDWNEADIVEEARDLFLKAGKKLQRRRQENEWRLASSVMGVGDPAEDSVELREKLKKNRSIAAVKETEIINKFAEKQNNLKLEGEEIGDNEAGESSDNSGDDVEINEDNQESTTRKSQLELFLKKKSRLSISSNECSTLKPQETQVKVGEELKINNSSCDGLNSADDNINIEVKSNTNSALTNTDCVNIDLSQSNFHDEKEEISLDNEPMNLSSASDENELEMLEKLYSENDVISDESSNEESPIAISDSSSDNASAIINLSDVVSIENSSTEINEDDQKKCPVIEEEDDVPFKFVKEENQNKLIVVSPRKPKNDLKPKRYYLSSSDEENISENKQNVVSAVERKSEDRQINDNTIKSADGQIKDNTIESSEDKQINENTIELSKDTQIKEKTDELSENRQIKHSSIEPAEAVATNGINEEVVKSNKQLQASKVDEKLIDDVLSDDIEKIRQLTNNVDDK